MIKLKFGQNMWGYEIIKGKLEVQNRIIEKVEGPKSHH
jgi:hypothetical protein